MYPAVPMSPTEVTERVDRTDRMLAEQKGRRSNHYLNIVHLVLEGLAFSSTVKCGLAEWS